jgi:hypothetical protein
VISTGKEIEEWNGLCGGNRVFVDGRKQLIGTSFACALKWSTGRGFK